LLSALLSPTFHLSIKEKKRKEKKTILIIGNCGDGKEEEGIAWTFCPAIISFFFIFGREKRRRSKTLLLLL
jgi:uncharacterized protein YijF (DUF1287 family)